MMSVPKKLLAVALLMLPGMVWAAYQAEEIGQADGATSLLIQPPVAFLSREPAPLMFPGPYDATELGFSMSYNDDAYSLDSPLSSSLIPQTHPKRFAATAVGGLAISQRIGLFGKFGLRYSSNGGALSSASFSEGASTQQLAHRYGLGVNVKASQVLSLQFQWERFGPAGVGVGADPTKWEWDPWKEKNVFGAGLRLGF